MRVRCYLEDGRVLERDVPSMPPGPPEVCIELPGEPPRVFTRTTDTYNGAAVYRLRRRR